MATEFHYQHPFPLGEDKTEYYLLTKDYVSVSEFEGQPILKIQKEIAAQKSNLKNELDLRLKFRYNFYDSGSSLNFGQGRTFATIGATFNLPLSKTKEYTDEYMIQNSEAKLKNNQTLIKNTLYSFYRDYREMQEDVQLLKNKNK